MTPESKVKHRALDLISKLDLGIYTFSPVQTGFGKATLDMLLCVRGKFLAIEFKANRNKMTLRQEFTQGAIEGAGGTVWLIDEENVESLPRLLKEFAGLSD